MTIALGERGVRGIVLDIEGTTTPVAFIYDVLFPFARAHLREHLREQLGPDEAKVSEQVAYFEALMDADSKDPELKRLQGKIWQRGYEEESLRGEVFADVPPALARWHAGGIAVGIYSSGSMLAQRLLFGSTMSGDLTRFVSHFFDTTVGAKRSPTSYQRIAASMGLMCRELVFISDVTEELDAARRAGMQALLSVRPGNAAQDEAAAEVIRSFDEIAA